jgi:hypothetical protein
MVQPEVALIECRSHLECNGSHVAHASRAASVARRANCSATASPTTRCSMVGLRNASRPAPLRRLGEISAALTGGFTSDTGGSPPAPLAYTLPPDPWTNPPDGQGTGAGALPPRLTMSPEELYLYELHGYLCAARQHQPFIVSACSHRSPHAAAAVTATALPG